MDNVLHFGRSIMTNRTESGNLLSVQLEKISSFLFQHGLLVSDCFDGHVLICHPELVNDVAAALKNEGFKPIILAASLIQLRQKEKISVVENRMLELLTPGPLILDRTDNDDELPISIPDSFDLKDIANIYGGCITGFLTVQYTDAKEVVDHLVSMGLSCNNIAGFGILESPNYNEDYPPLKASVARVYGPGNVRCLVEGYWDQVILEEASKQISVWEIGEWT